MDFNNLDSSDTCLKKIVYWDEIEKSGEGEYDEAFLASLRAELKMYEHSQKQVIIVPMRFSGNDKFWGCSDTEVMSEQAEVELFEIFTTSFLHLSRRIKDCKNVIGFVNPDFTSDWEFLQHYSLEYKNNFMAAFQKKHSHFVFID